MSDLLSEQLHQANGASRPLKREHDSSDDFEHLEHELQLRAEPQQPLLDLSADFLMGESKAPPGGLLQLDNLLDESLPPGPGPQLHPVPATPPPSAELDGPKPASHAFLRAERGSPEPSGFAGPSDDEDEEDDEEDVTEPERSQSQGTPAHLAARPPPPPPPGGLQPERNLLDDDEDFLGDEFAPPQPSSRPLPDLDARDFLAASLPEPQRSPERDFLRDELLVSEATRQLEPPTKPLPPLPADELEPDERGQLPPPPPPPQLLQPHPAQLSGGETDEFESEPEPSPARNPPKPAAAPAAAPTSSNSSSWLGDAAERKVFCHKAPSADLDEIAPKEIFRHIGIDAWFNPERLNPKVAALIYWRDPKNSGIVFGATLGVLLSLAYFSLISVVAYVSLLTLTFTVAFRIYKTVLQAIQKTSDGHPFKDILDLDLTLPAEKVHQVADIAVANANAAASELRRLFLVEDFVDSLKFGILLWSLTYLGAWFNGMTLIIIGVVALFSLPKVYETNKTQIDQNLALVQAKINEITAKVKAALPLSKKADPSKEE